MRSHDSRGFAPAGRVRTDRRLFQPPAGRCVTGQPYPRSFSTAWGAEFACCSTDVADCTRICERVSCDVSVAKSVSRIALCELDTFSNATFSELIVELSVFDWNAPSRPRRFATSLIAWL